MPSTASISTRLNQRLRRVPQARPPSPNMPGKSSAQAIRFGTEAGRAGVIIAVCPTPCPWVRITTDDVGGQAAAGDPAAQLAGVVDTICTVVGVNEQAASLGSPEQESVINIGEVTTELFTGVTVIVAVPAVPAI